jgi:PAS domain S-box-containing protein
MNFDLDKKNTVFYYIAIIVIAMLLAVFYYNFKVVKSTGYMVDHSNDVINKNNEVLLDLVNIETGTRGYLLTDKQEFLSTYNQSLKTIIQKKEDLLTLTKDNPSQQKRVKKLIIQIDERIDFARKLILDKREITIDKKVELELLLAGKALTDSIRNSIKEINSAELILLKDHKINNNSSAKFSSIILFIIILFLVLLILFIFYLFKIHNKRNSELELYNKHQKDASQYSLSLIEASRDPLFTISPQGKITDTNQASVRVTDVSKEDLINTDFINYFTEPEKAKIGYEEVFLKGFVIDYPLTIKDGKLTPVLFNGAVYKDENDNIIGAVVVARDITEQKKTQKELIEAKTFAELASSVAEEAKIIAETATTKANEAVKSKQQFLSNMSHEIRTPMNAIIGFTKVVLKTELTAKQKEYLTAIKLSGDALIVLINDILDLAKVDAGKMIFEKTPFKIRLSIKAMLHLFETKIQEKNLKLTTHIDHAIPEVLVGDPVRLHQIILNLVSNAVKFTNEGKISVDIKLVSETDDDVAIQFSIIDTGIGVIETKIESIFENFQQATSGTSRIFGGTGLGLAIVKQLVEAQNGTITVESTLGKGSTFSFVLYFDKTSNEAVLEPEILEIDTEIKDTKILVVEDMELNQLLMKTLLDDFGFECDVAANGKIAIDKLKNHTYDIILMDLQMPEMNGFEATEYIRNKMKLEIPIIALTADVTTVDVAKCKAVGMNDYISKPVDERLLYSKLINFIKKPVAIIENKTVGNQKIQTIKYVDFTYLSKLTKDNPKLMTEMIQVYLKQTPPLLLTMKQSLKDKDWHLLKASAHKIVPSFTIMGIHSEYTELARKIQVYAEKLEQSEELNDMVSQLEKVCNQSFIELKNELINLKS